LYKNHLYHFVLNIERLKSILSSGILKVDYRIYQPAISLARNPNYLLNRGIRMVFDKDKLKHNYKICPFDFNFYSKNKKRKYLDEMEERCYHNIDIYKTCHRIDIDLFKYEKLFEHKLLNYTCHFKLYYTNFDIENNRS
jgi:hypothetical protein